MTRTLLLTVALNPRQHWVCEKRESCTTAFLIIYFRAPRHDLNIIFSLKPKIGPRIQKRRRIDREKRTDMSIWGG